MKSFGRLTVPALYIVNIALFFSLGAMQQNKHIETLYKGFLEHNYLNKTLTPSERLSFIIASTLNTKKKFLEDAKITIGTAYILERFKNQIFWWDRDGVLNDRAFRSAVEIWDTNNNIQDNIQVKGYKKEDPKNHQEKFKTIYNTIMLEVSRHNQQIPDITTRQKIMVYFYNVKKQNNKVHPPRPENKK